MTFKNWLKNELKRDRFRHSPNGDFAEDVLRDRTWKEPVSLEALDLYLGSKRACDEARKVGKTCYRRWQKSLGSKKPKGKKKIEKCDGLGPHEIKKIRSAIRLVWHRSHARRLVVLRCTGKDGFARCEKCKDPTPALKIDHRQNVGDVDGGFIERLFCPSSGLQGLCKKCHDAKTKLERAFKKATVRI